MPEHLTDFKITKVYEGKSGKGKYGPWTAYNFYTDKTGEEKFSYFWGEGKTIVIEGIQVDYMEYETETKGQYTNLNVKKLEISDKSTSEAIPKVKEDIWTIPKPKNDREVSFYVAYAKDLAIELLAKSGNLHNLEDTCKQVAKAGKIMMNESLNNGQIPPEKPQEGSPVEDKDKNKGEGKGTSPQQEEDLKLTATLKKYAKKDNKLYFETLGVHGAEKAEEVLEFAKEAQDSLLRDLEKAFEEPDF